MKWTISALVSSIGLLGGAALPGNGQNSSEVTKVLADTVAQEEIPGIVGAITSSDGIIALSSAGVRKFGTDVPLRASDLIHLGSCTKAMTAALMANLVAEEKLRWETTIIEILPEMQGVIAPGYHGVSLWELLTHRAGVPANAANWWSFGRLPIVERRIAVLKAALKIPAVPKRGQYHYSNLGYMIAGCMAERVTGKTWEFLIRDRIFIPLGMASAGFGSPGTIGETDQPWGHVRNGKSWIARQSDNAPALGPAGRIHCSISDWARFLRCYLRNEPCNGLNEQVRLKLVTPSGNYAGGWVIVERNWAKGAVFTHTGSNTMWYAMVWVAPGLDRAFAVATNSCGERSHAICDQVIEKLIRIDQRSR